jgi:hypothetical protein
MEAWVKREVEGCEFPDSRLKNRFAKLLGRLGEKIGAALPTACQDWAATKAAYRFFSNPRVDEGIILAGHFAATKSRIAAAKGAILILHDTTEFSFQRNRPEAIGKTRIIPAGRIGSKPITKCGLLLHSSLAITTAGKPLGLTAVKFWTRQKFKGTNALKGRGVEGGKHSVNSTRIPIEQKESIRWLENLQQSTQLVNPDRCVHIGDRESDI